MAVRTRAYMTQNRAIWTILKTSHPVLWAFVAVFIFIDSRKAICCQCLWLLSYLVGLKMNCQIVKTTHREADALQLCSSFPAEVVSELLASAFVIAAVLAFKKVTDIMISNFEQSLQTTTLLGALCDLQITVSKELLIETGARALGQLLGREVAVGSHFLDFLPRGQQDRFYSFFQEHIKTQLKQRTPHPINIELLGQAGQVVPVAVLVAASPESKYAMLGITSNAEVQPPQASASEPMARAISEHRSRSEVARSEKYCYRFEPEEDVGSVAETLLSSNPEEHNRQQAAEVASHMEALAEDESQVFRWQAERCNERWPEIFEQCPPPPLVSNFVIPSTNEHTMDDDSGSECTLSQ
eukprot:TRINITY_DN9029_c0_g1_i3.p1 TRINITY_DN9029_c0_g1~~TRINITY_DN9029_c0_g1_i3.p1  ORF type:complete len:355 (+),score=42.78 TRINITY_DN9029_c0_g1_i3:391-1455(+)